LQFSSLKPKTKIFLTGHYGTCRAHDHVKFILIWWTLLRRGSRT
jgi:hypothetical protein